MKEKLKKLRDIVIGGLLLIGAGSPAAFAWFSPTNFETSKMIAVSTTPASPTKLLDALSGDASVCIQPLWSGTGTKPNGEGIVIADTNVTIATNVATGYARIPAGNLVSEIFCIGDYKGALYGVTFGTGTPLDVMVLRKR